VSIGSELLAVLLGVAVGLVLGAGSRWARGRRRRRSRDATRLLGHLAATERELRRAIALREALVLRSADEGEWWRPASDLAAGLRDAAVLCGDPRLARLPDPVPVEEVVRAARAARDALRAEVLPAPPPPPEGLVLLRRSAGAPARAPRS
jgi:hypothetical protein